MFFFLQKFVKVFKRSFEELAISCLLSLLLLLLLLLFVCLFCNIGWVIGGFLIPLPSWEAKGYDSFCFGVLPQASVYPSHTPSSL